MYESVLFWFKQFSLKLKFYWLVIFALKYQIINLSMEFNIMSIFDLFCSVIKQVGLIIHAYGWTKWNLSNFAHLKEGKL